MITFQQTCGACPEQYDAYEDGKIVGYVRLRNGRFTVRCPDVCGELVYSTAYGDDWCGAFDSDVDRRRHLARARRAIRNFMSDADLLPVEDES